jgi:hypothetical protein
VTIVVLLGGNAFWQHRAHLDAAAAVLEQEKSRELPADWGKKMSQAKRETSSRALAQHVFVASGTLTPYFEASGQRRVYAPTPDDIKRREARVAAAARIDFRAGSSLTEAVLWLVLGLGALVFGLCFGFERAAKPQDAEAEGGPAPQT